MDHLVALAGFVEKFKNPAELAGLWQGIEEHLRFDDEETEVCVHCFPEIFLHHCPN